MSRALTPTGRLIVTAAIVGAAVLATGVLIFSGSW